ncbi:hypothetical protein BaRGS_00035789 [Batillaria attramentaria]|uniref:Uncharacterized protein n=1 Tax=Batillaria attramentaria TaxID=370345 RepID=A0ABD0JDU7_9CAEN
MVPVAGQVSTGGWSSPRASLSCTRYCQGGGGPAGPFDALPSYLRAISRLLTRNAPLAFHQHKYQIPRITTSHLHYNDDGLQQRSYVLRLKGIMEAPRHQRPWFLLSHVVHVLCLLALCALTLTFGAAHRGNNANDISLSPDRLTELGSRGQALLRNIAIMTHTCGNTQMPQLRRKRLRHSPVTCNDGSYAG